MRFRGWPGIGVCAALAVALSGCGTIKSMFKPDRPPPMEIVIPPVHSDEPTVAAAVPPAFPRPKPIEAPLPTAKDFVNMSVDEVRRLIGKPTLLRQDHKVQVWHYRNLDCTLFLFFYPRGAEGYRVNHIDVADTRANPASGPGAAPGQAHRQMLESCVASTMMSFGSRGL